MATQSIAHRPPAAQQTLTLPIWLQSALLAVIDVLLLAVASNYFTLRLFLEVAPPWLTDPVSSWRALRTARRAARVVPAYARFLGEHHFKAGAALRVADLPETDKATYIDRNPLSERCVDGVIPLVGTTIDESSGSTGTPYNWVRSATERHHVQRMISFFTRYTFGDRPLVILNAFSMGAWATGLTTAIALEHNGLVKATGPDIDKILDVLRLLGPRYPYLIVGYPPFLKRLLDAADEAGLDWSAYEMHALMGGEGNSEALRDYLLRRFRSAFSGYGATDVEIGLAAETPVCIAVRRLAMSRPDVARSLFGDADRVPMVFQYNPLLHHIETNAAGELLFTVTRHATLSPKVRYNVHDEGGVLREDELRYRLAELGVGLDTLAPGGWKSARLPFLFVFGRKDWTISVMGANVYPQDVEAAIYRNPTVARRVRSFTLSIVEPTPGETRPCVSVELEREHPTEALSAELREAIHRHLLAVNRDYREAASEFPELVAPVVRLHAAGEGPFTGAAARIKFRYIER